MSSLTSTANTGTARNAGIQLVAGQFHVVPFRRDAEGSIVPGTVVDFPNGDIAWRYAKAVAFDRGNIGAIEIRDGVVLAQFGAVNLHAIDEKNPSTAGIA